MRDLCETFWRLWKWFYQRMLEKASKPTPSKKEKKPEKVRDTPETRTAVHEAGHLICIWYCTQVLRVQSVSIHSKGGQVQHTYRWPVTGMTPSNKACMMVIALGGIAAESMVFGTFRSGEAESDLTKALTSAQELRNWPLSDVTGDLTDEEWQLKGRVPPFRKMFSGGLGQADEHFLDNAYRFARQLLSKRLVEHGKVTSALLAHKTLTHEKLESILGHRAGMLLIGLFKGSFR